MYASGKKVKFVFDAANKSHVGVAIFHSVIMLPISQANPLQPLL